MFRGSHFDFDFWQERLEGRGSAIFEISISKNPVSRIFMLLSASAQLDQKLLHIRPITSTISTYNNDNNDDE